MFQYQGNNYHRIALLGAGRYFNGKRKYIDDYISFAVYADNDSEKWGKQPYNDGIECVEPCTLKERGVDFVIIGVREGTVQETLIAQVTALSIPWCILDDVIDLYIDDYDLARRERSQKVVKEFFAGKEGHHRLILLNTPQVTSTVGDHAISTAELIFLKKYFAGRTLIEMGDVFFWENKEEIKRYIRPSDTLLIQGGGYLGSLWRNRREDAFRYILQAYPENRIVVLPMTMFFEDTEDGRRQFEISKEVYNSHEKLTICFRERKSYELSKTILGPRIKKYLIPDAVTSLEYTPDKERNKKGVAVFFKNDKETILSDEQQNQLREWLHGNGYDMKETTMFYPNQIHSAEEREQMIWDKVKELAGYELVITDAMHGMVLAVVSGTACVGVESITGKVGGIYEWFEPLTYVEYAQSYDEILQAIEKLRDKKENFYDNAHLKKYFDKLIEIISPLKRNEEKI